MSAETKAAVDQLEALLRDLPDGELVKLIDVCCHQINHIADLLIPLPVVGDPARRMAFLAAISAMAAGKITPPTALSADSANEVRRMLDRLTNGGRS